MRFQVGIPIVKLIEQIFTGSLKNGTFFRVIRASVARIIVFEFIAVV